MFKVLSCVRNSDTGKTPNLLYLVEKNSAFGLYIMLGTILKDVLGIEPGASGMQTRATYLDIVADHADSFSDTP